MDGTFSYKTTERQRRLDPRALKLAVAAGLLVFVVGSFARWVIDSERASFAKVHAAEQAAAASSPLPESPPVDAVTADAVTADSAERALTAARVAIGANGNLADASPEQLTQIDPGLTYVVGPSAQPQVVSVASTRKAWAAAVMSSSGTCFYLRLAAGDSVTYGTGLDCTGTAALAASGPSW